MLKYVEHHKVLDDKSKSKAKFNSCVLSVVNEQDSSSDHFASI